MRKIPFIQSTDESDSYFQTRDGKMIRAHREGWFFRYDNRVDLEKGEYLSGLEDEEECRASCLPTVQHLCDSGELTFHYSYREFVIGFGFIRKMPERRIRKIIREAAKQGFTLTRKYILEMFENWHYGWKSGILDKEHNCHYFTPCGLNPFSLRITSLHPAASDWQITYRC